MSIVKFRGDGYEGEVHFEKSEDALKFYFEQCKDDRAILIYHNEDPFEYDWKTRAE